MQTVINRTMDYYKLVPLFIKSGLEIHEEDPVPEGLVTCFEMLNEETGELVGASGLVHYKGIYIVRCIAVDEKYRGYGYGRALVEIVIEEAKKLGAKEAWLTGKIPRFYEKFGFEVVDRSVAPRISNCQECKQFHNGCESEIMRIKF